MSTTAVNQTGSSQPRSLARDMSSISRFTLISRILGLVRDQAFAALVGASQGIYSDAFLTAFRIPNLLRDLFAEGALSAAFVPVYARTLTQEGRAEAHRLANRMMTLLTVVLGAMCLLGVLAAPIIVRALAPGFSDTPGKTDLTAHLTRITMPFLPMVSLAAVAMGMLNAEERYRMPAFSPAMFNLVALIVAAFLWWRGFPPRQVVVGWSIGTLAGGLGQFAVQWPELHRTGWRWGFDWAPGDSRVREVLGLMTPAAIGLAAVQINIFIGVGIASHEQGAQAWLLQAFRILYLPIGLFGVALGTITATGAAIRAAAGDLEGLREAVRRALRLLVFLTVPATLGLMVLAEPIVRLLFQRGRYRPEDTSATAAALVLYSLGLVAYTAVKVLAPAFYGLGTARVPMAGSVAAVCSSVAVMISLHGWIGYGAVALGTSAGAFVNVGLLVVMFQRRVGGLRRQGLMRSSLRVALATLPMALVTYGLAALIERSWGTGGLAVRALAGLLPVAAGVAAYFGAALWLDIPEAGVLVGLARRAFPVRKTSEL